MCPGRCNLAGHVGAPGPLRAMPLTLLRPRDERSPLREDDSPTQ